MSFFRNPTRLPRLRYVRLGVLSVLAVLALQPAAEAHVKWFTSYDFAERPLTLQQVLTPAFLLLALMSLAEVGVLVVLDERLSRLDGYRRFSDWLEGHRDKSVFVVRVATGSVMLLSWQMGVMLVPEIAATPWAGAYQLLLAVLLFSNQMLRPAGVGVLVLYGFALVQYGPLHMLDYAYFAGAGYYLAVADAGDPKLRASGLPVLYATVGLSLSWAALEKLFYPQWGLRILTEHPHLTFGLNPDFFLTASALVEFCIGFLLILCLLQRLFALLVTGLFISTTIVFGKVEFIGHAIVHAALIVFLLEGPGSTFRTPITFFKHLHQRVTVATVGFVLVLFGLIGSYADAAHDAHDASASAVWTAHDGAPEAGIEVGDAEDVPLVEVAVHRDTQAGWNLELLTEHFHFTPEHSGAMHRLGEGHAHVFLDGRQIARVYGPWYHLPVLEPGTHALRVTLNANDHRVYTVDGTPVADELLLVIAETEDGPAVLSMEASR